MRQANLQAQPVAKWRATTDSAHRFPVVANHLNRQFTVAAPNQVWAGDLTYIWTREGWLYLAILLDLCSRAVVGWAMGVRLTEELTQHALQRALHRRQPQPGVLHHSDRGTPYAANAYQQRLRAAGITGSMSRRGTGWDNACVESFFGTLKRDLIHHRQYPTRDEATQEIVDSSKCFIIDSAAIPPSAIDLRRSLKPQRLSRNPGSTQLGEGQVMRYDKELASVLRASDFHPRETRTGWCFFQRHDINPAKVKFFRFHISDTTGEEATQIVPFPSPRRDKVEVNYQIGEMTFTGRRIDISKLRLKYFHPP